MVIKYFQCSAVKLSCLADRGGSRTRTAGLNALRVGSRSLFRVFLKGPNEVGAEMSALIGRVGFRQWARARPSQGDAVALTLPGSLQVRYLRVVIVTM